MQRINKRNGVGNYPRRRCINSISVIIASSEFKARPDNYSKFEDWERDSAYVKHRTKSVFDKSSDEEIWEMSILSLLHQ